MHGVHNRLSSEAHVRLAAVLTAACLFVGCGRAAESSAPAPTEENSCTPGTYGVAAYDALVDVRVSGRVALTDARIAEWISTPVAAELARALVRSGQIEPRIDQASRAALQNDVWGLVERVSALDVTSVDTNTILAAGRTLVRRLAPARIDIPPVGGRLPGALSVLGPGFVERESEMPVLQHELVFGLRRFFRVAVRGTDDSERAMFSVLLALDERGIPFRTGIVGDLEVLRFEGDHLRSARLFELDRRRLRCEGADHALREVDHVTQVPGLGADRAIAAFDPPVALADLPCARCHIDANTMSLPRADFPLGRRQTPLLDQQRARARSLFLL